MCYCVFEIIVTVQRDIRPFVGNGVEIYGGFDRLPIVAGSLYLASYTMLKKFKVTRGIVMNISNKKYVSYLAEKHDDYKRFIKIILKNSDKVCFTVRPSLDNIDEFRDSIWSFLSESILYTSCEKAATDGYNEKSDLIVLKNDKEFI